MGRDTDRERDRPLGARFFCQGYCFLDRLFFPCSDDLTGAVVVCRRRVAAPDREADRIYPVPAEAEDGGHESFPLGYGFLHEYAATFGQCDGVPELENACSDKGGIFAEAVPRDDGRRDSFFLKAAQGGDA